MSCYEDLVERIERLEKENREVCQLMASTIIAVMENSNRDPPVNHGSAISASFASSASSARSARDLPVNQNNFAEDSEITSGYISGGKTLL